jgi:hypothetical protein
MTYVSPQTHAQPKPKNNPQKIPYAYIGLNSKIWHLVSKRKVFAEKCLMPI